MENFIDRESLLAGVEPTLEDHEYELWGQNVRADFFTADQMAAAVAIERERCLDLVDAFAHNNTDLAAAIRGQR